METKLSSLNNDGVLEVAWALNTIMVWVDYIIPNHGYLSRAIVLFTCDRH